MHTLHRSIPEFLHNLLRHSYRLRLSLVNHNRCSLAQRSQHRRPISRMLHYRPQLLQQPRELLQSWLDFAFQSSKSLSLTRRMSARFNKPSLCLPGKQVGVRLNHICSIGLALSLLLSSIARNYGVSVPCEMVKVCCGPECAIFSTRPSSGA